MKIEDGDAVLVACPTYQGLEYCLDEYLAAYDAFAWPNRALMLVDNTRDEGAYFARLQKLIETGPRRYVRHVEPRLKPDGNPGTFEETFYACWQTILSHAKFNGYPWVLSLEQDVILPKLGLDALLNIASYTAAPFVTHLYPFHGGRAGLYQGLGCILMATKLLEVALETEYRAVPLTEAAIYGVGLRASHVSLRDLLDLKHLDPPPGIGKPWQYGTDNDPRAIAIEA